MSNISKINKDNMLEEMREKYINRYDKNTANGEDIVFFERLIPGEIENNIKKVEKKLEEKVQILDSLKKNYIDGDDGINKIKHVIKNYGTTIKNNIAKVGVLRDRLSDITTEIEREEDKILSKRSELNTLLQDKEIKDFVSETKKLQKEICDLEIFF